MGCPDIYYKMCLQYLANSLVFKEDEELAEELFTDESEKKLEEFILNKKKEIDEKEFYFEAGRAGQFMVEIVYENDGNDILNAVTTGFSMFKDFIGLKKEE